jgi:uncharacterized membrane protein YqjE
MREIFDKLAFMLTGLIHLLPFAGLSGADRLEALYGVNLAGEPALTLLMQHRALMFGIIGLLALIAAWRPALRPTARLVALASMLGFAALYLLSGLDAAPLAKVYWADLVASILLLATCAPPRTRA